MDTPQSGWPDPPFSEPWTQRFLSVARNWGDVEATCREAGITLDQYVQRRDSDPAFHAVCVLIDRIVEFKIVEVIRGRALSGNVPAARLYFKTIRPLLFPPDEPAPPVADLAPMPMTVMDADAPAIVVPAPEVQDSSEAVVAAPEPPEPRSTPDATAAPARKTEPRPAPGSPVYPVQADPSSVGAIAISKLGTHPNGSTVARDGPEAVDPGQRTRAGVEDKPWRPGVSSQPALFHLRE